MKKSFRNVRPCLVTIQPIVQTPKIFNCFNCNTELYRCAYLARIEWILCCFILFSIHLFCSGVFLLQFLVTAVCLYHIWINNIEICKTKVEIELKTEKEKKYYQTSLCFVWNISVTYAKHYVGALNFNGNIWNKKEEEEIYQSPWIRQPLERRIRKNKIKEAQTHQWHLIQLMVWNLCRMM